MARIRTVKPEMALNEELALCTPWAQLLAVRILNQADDEGYFKASPAMLKAACFPLVTDQSLDAHGALMELSNIGYVDLFEGSDGKPYGHVRNFNTHQTISRPTQSKIKELRELKEDSMSAHGVASEDSSGKERKERKGKPPKRASAEDRSLAEWMAGKLRRINPTMKDPSLDSWADDVRKLREIDRRSEAEIRAQFEWANGDSFWQANILCPATLRRQWDKLTFQRQRKGNGADPNAEFK